MKIYYKEIIFIQLFIVEMEVSPVFKMGSTEIHFLKNDKFALRDDSIVPKYFEGKDYKMASTSTSSNGLFDLVQVKSEGDNYLLLINYLINNTKLVVY